MMKKVKAFTILDVLVVIAVLAIMAAILLPALARSKDRYRLSLHKGDRVEIIGLGVKGVIDSLDFDDATVLAQGNDGFPVKLEHVKVNILRKY